MLKVSLHLFAIAVVVASGTVFGQPNDLAERLLDADEEQFAEIFPKWVVFETLEKRIEKVLPILIEEIDRKLPPDASDEAKQTLAKRQVNAAVVLIRMNRAEKVWPILKHSPDPSVRSHLIHLAPALSGPAAIIKRLGTEPDVSIRRALLLCLGEFDERELSLKDRIELLPQLQEIYRTEADPGLHSASEWLLRTWKQKDWLQQVNQEWANDEEQRNKRLEGIQQLLLNDNGKSQPQWFVNRQGQTLVIIPAPVEFVMGSPETEFDNEKQHKRRVERTFAIATKLITVEQFLRFHKDYEYRKDYAPTDDCPVNTVTWYEAAKYCNWLNEQEGISKEQWCYEPNDEGKYCEGMTMTSDFLQRTGYRLPTEAEWEYACRAGSVTRYSFGESDDLLTKYAWFDTNSMAKSHPVGLLKPNDFGLFDMHGNSCVWCQDLYEPYANGEAKDDNVENLRVNDSGSRVLRGGTFATLPSYVNSAFRYSHPPSSRYLSFGVRLARTLPPISFRQ